MLQQWIYFSFQYNKIIYIHKHLFFFSLFIFISIFSLSSTHSPSRHHHHHHHSSQPSHQLTTNPWQNPSSICHQPRSTTTNPQNPCSSPIGTPEPTTKANTSQLQTHPHPNPPQNLATHDHDPPKEGRHGSDLPRGTAVIYPAARRSTQCHDPSSDTTRVTQRGTRERS